MQNEIVNSPVENKFKIHGDKINKYFIKYVTLINDFLNYACNNLNTDNTEVLKHNIQKGIQALTHIFKIILIRSDDINHTIDITQKCFFYYVEFVTQITNSNDHIQLSLNDAIIFLYKKSIFQYDDKENAENSFDFSNNTSYIISSDLQKLIEVHNELVYYYINVFENHNYSFNDFTKSIYLFTENIITVHTINNINGIHNFIKYFKFNKINFTIIINLLTVFIKHINGKYVNSDSIFTKLIKLNIMKNIVDDEKYNNKITHKLITSL